MACRDRCLSYGWQGSLFPVIVSHAEIVGVCVWWVLIKVSARAGVVCLPLVSPVMIVRTAPMHDLSCAGLTVLPWLKSLAKQERCLPVAG